MIRIRRRGMCGALAFSAVLVSGLAVLPAGNGAARPPDKPVDFNRDIRPILSDNCFTCHGPDERNRVARLRFDTREGAFAKPGVIVAGNAAASRLFQRISAADAETRMPPVISGRRLTEGQIDLLRRWLDEGAKWDTHWAFIPARRPELPSVRNTSWPRNPIDRFILARLESEGLQPSPQADRVMLLRRVAFDLTGLPPTPADVDSFVRDKSSDAYEKRVEALLASSRYGERMATPWLDQARYADTHGYHIDSHRDMWPWRDWVVRAFNENRPFDRFTIEQLAGDLLPGATLEQKIASGFNRNHMINFEGGAIPEEYLVEYVVDRVETTSQAWMGLTMGCARCHNHKYDPITQKEFYRFFALFNSVPENGLDGRTGNAEPVLSLPTPAQEPRMKELDSAIRAIEESLADARVAPLQDAWERDFGRRPGGEPRRGLLAHYELDGNLSDISGAYRHGSTVRGDPSFGAGTVGRSVSFDGDTHVKFAGVAPLERDRPFSLATWVRVNSNVPLALLHQLDDPQTRRGCEVFFEDIGLVGIQHWAARLNVRLSSRSPDDSIQIRATERVSFGDWHHLALTWDGSGKSAGFHLYVDGKLARTDTVRDALSGPIGADTALSVGDAAFGKPYRGQLDDLRVYGRALEPGEVEELAVHYPIRSILSGVLGKRSKEDAARVREYFLTREAPEAVRSEHAELRRLKKDRDELRKQILNVMVMGESAKPRDTWVLERGDYRNHGEKVEPGVPAVLPGLPEDAPPNRLTLARWLVDPAHPLTARVAVNRFWQMCFGTGIVKTAENFGSQGESPSHPELLDWLSTEFVRSGWDVKAMLRLIVTSAAYRQSSRSTPALLEKDPENRLLARGPRFRLPAEMVRDSALAASGLLNGEIGGAGFYPYQPKGLWEEMAFGDGFSAQEYRQSTGRDLYRRGLYVFWKRTVPNPVMLTFDAPDREKCSARRTLTNTPLQALALMNDPTFVEAARALAARTIREAGRSAESRVTHAFRLVTARAPQAAEIRVLRELLDRQLSRFRHDPKSAGELLTVGDSPRDASMDPVELAAWTMVSSAILNLDEAITRQ